MSQVSHGERWAVGQFQDHGTSICKDGGTFGMLVRIVTCVRCGLEFASMGTVCPMCLNVRWNEVEEFRDMGLGNDDGSPLVGDHGLCRQGS